MGRLTIGSAALAALCLILASANAPRASVGESRPEGSIPFSNIPLLESRISEDQEGTFDIRDDIRRGQEFLKDKVAGYCEDLEQKSRTFVDKRGRKREKVVWEKVVRPNFLLAVEDLRERKIQEVLITSKGCVTSGFQVTTCRANGVGSRFEVDHPEHMAVLALRTMVHDKGDTFKEVVYTPYSPEIDTWQVRKAGLDYLVRQIDLAYGDLKAREVRLTGFGRLGADMTPVEVALVLSIIEHIDPVRFTNCQEGQETALVHEVLAIIGANTINAYAYSKSPAGAWALPIHTQDLQENQGEVSQGKPQQELRSRMQRSCECRQGLPAPFRFRPGRRAAAMAARPGEECPDHRHVPGSGLQLRREKGREIGEGMRAPVDLQAAGRDENLPEEVRRGLGHAKGPRQVSTASR